MKIKAKIFSIVIFTIMAVFFNTAYCNAADDKAIKPETTVEKKNEANNVLVKFFITMLWVGGSCAVIYLILLGYKKLSRSRITEVNTIDIDKNLNSPDTIEDAAKLFIEKF